MNLAAQGHHLVKIFGNAGQNGGRNHGHLACHESGLG
jgi:hypothetical protein